MHANIQRLRVARGLTQSEFGAQVGADKTLVSHWETGKSAPALDRLIGVAAALGVTVDELLAPQKATARSTKGARAS